MSQKINGIITSILPEISGTSANGNAYRIAEYVVTYDNSNPQYPKAVLFKVMGDAIDRLNLQMGVSYELSIDFTVTTYNGKPRMEARCWKAKENAPQQQADPHN